MKNIRLILLVSILVFNLGVARANFVDGLFEVITTPFALIDNLIKNDGNPVEAFKDTIDIIFKNGGGLVDEMNKHLPDPNEILAWCKKAEYDAIKQPDGTLLVVKKKNTGNCSIGESGNLAVGWNSDIGFHFMGSPAGYNFFYNSKFETPEHFEKGFKQYLKAHYYKMDEIKANPEIELNIEDTDNESDFETLDLLAQAKLLEAGTYNTMVMTAKKKEQVSYYSSLYQKSINEYKSIMSFIQDGLEVEDTYLSSFLDIDGNLDRSLIFQEVAYSTVIHSRDIAALPLMLEGSSDLISVIISSAFCLFWDEDTSEAEKAADLAGITIDAGALLAPGIPATAGYAKLALFFGRTVDKAHDAGKIAKATMKPVSNIREFFSKGFGKNIKANSIPTSNMIQGQKVFKVKNKMINSKHLKKGDQFYLDASHKNHIEVFDSRGRAKNVLNLDGTINVEKTTKALKEGRRI
jgi:hypothetical protein